MKRTKEMFAGGFYLLKGLSSANSSFIEDKAEAIRFIQECNKRLLAYAEIHDYLLTKDGWVLLVSLLDEETIKRNYKAKWEKSIRVKKEYFLTEVWKIISEQVRHIRFTFVKYTNRKNGREGSKIKRSYERFWFDSLEEATGYLTKMRRQLIKLCQKLKTYHTKKNHFRISRTEAKGAVFLCSLNCNEDVKSDVGWGCSLKLFYDNVDVLRNLVIRTIKLHKRQNHQHFHLKVE